MFLKNFFGEKICIENINDIENELEKQYGLPKEHQNIHKIGDNFFISMCEWLDNYDTKDTNNNSGELTESLEKLGIPPVILEKISKMNENQANTFIKFHLLPYIFKNSSYSVMYSKIDKTGISNIDEYIEKISSDDRDVILKHVDSYIDSFLK